MDKRLIVLETRFDTILPTLATKADLVALKSESKAAMSKLGADLRTEMHASTDSLRTEIHAFKADIFKWMAATLMTIFIGFNGMILTMLTLLRPG